MSCSAFRLSLDVLRICEVALYGIFIASAGRPVVTSIVRAYLVHAGRAYEL
jgi:hypothetical protein